MKNTKVLIGDYEFVKSSFSGRFKCVGVAIDGEFVMVTNTNKPESIIKFTKEEWRAFILGVKNNEFDV